MFSNGELGDEMEAFDLLVLVRRAWWSSSVAPGRTGESAFPRPVRLRTQGLPCGGAGAYVEVKSWPSLILLSSFGFAASQPDRPVRAAFFQTTISDGGGVGIALPSTLAAGFSVSLAPFFAQHAPAKPHGNTDEKTRRKPSVSSRFGAGLIFVRSSHAPYSS
jgi:hypothetical protein